MRRGSDPSWFAIYRSPGSPESGSAGPWMYASWPPSDSTATAEGLAVEIGDADTIGTTAWTEADGGEGTTARTEADGGGVTIARRDPPTNNAVPTVPTRTAATASSRHGCPVTARRRTATRGPSAATTARIDDRRSAGAPSPARDRRTDSSTSSRTRRSLIGQPAWPRSTRSGRRGVAT